MKITALLGLFLSTLVYSQSDEILKRDWDNFSFSKKYNQEQVAKLKRSLAEVELNVLSSEHNIADIKKKLVFALNQEELLADEEKLLKMREGVDQEVINSHLQFMSCDANTPEISLEEKIPYPGANFQGPFFGVPRDNQAGFGTCYANTAKNLLVGTSRGEDVASFLDLALQSKDNKEILASALMGGESCSVLRRLKKSGFCPQAFAPYETGDKNIFAEGLLGRTEGNIRDLSSVVTLVQNFLIGQDKLSKDNNLLSEQMMARAQAIIQEIKMRPDVLLPMPVVRSQIPGSWKLKALTYSNKNINKDQLYLDYKSDYRRFYPQYVRSVVSGKGRDEIFELYLKTMKPFIDKYQINDQMKSWKQSFMDDTESDWTRPKLKSELAASLSFMKAISGQRDITNEKFLETCGDTLDSMAFLGTLQPLVKHLKNNSIETNILFDEKGRFKNAVELMQLVVAPACLNKVNRKIPVEDILCHEGVPTVSLIRFFGKTPEAQTKMFRQRVLASLLQGYPLGNTFDGHINTIVGMRYNKESKECELKIRESQDGKSSWELESAIYSKISGLTEVRRNPR
jgi:hypothetical protein